MPKSSSNRSNQNKSSLQSGVAGASGGTLLLLLAKNLPDNNSIKSWLILIAPTLSVAIAWGARKIDRYYKEKKVKALKKQLLNTINAALDNPHASALDKEKLKKKLVELDMADIEALSDRINSIDIDEK